MQRVLWPFAVLNLFIANADSVKWALDPDGNKLFNIRMKGEAYGLRALHMYFLLGAHAGFTEDGRLMGVPIITELQTLESNVNLPRATFDACVKQIYKDLDSAEAKLPIEYNDIATASQIPDRFKVATQKPEIYNRVMGQYSRQLFNGLIAKSFRARTALLAASPTFQHPSNSDTCVNLAENAGAVIDYKGGVNALPATGVTYIPTQPRLMQLAVALTHLSLSGEKTLSRMMAAGRRQTFHPPYLETEI